MALLSEIRFCVIVRAMAATALLTLISVSHASSLLFPTSYDDSSPHTINIRFFVSEVELRSRGEVQFELHTNGSLYSGVDLFESVRSGDAFIGEIIFSALVEVHPIFLIDNMPFLVRSFDSAEYLWLASRPAIERLLDQQGVRLLYATPWPPQALFTTHSVRSLSDLQGASIRSYSRVTEDLITAMGAVPVNVSANSIEDAFKQNRISAMITSATTGVRSQSWQYIDHYYDINAWIPKNMVFVNAAAFDALPMETQRIMLDAASKAEVRGWKVAREEYHRSRITLTDNGMSVRRPSAQLNQELDQLGQQLLQRWRQEAGDEGERIIEQLSRLNNTQ